MKEHIDRGQIVLASDPYNNGGKRPFVIISDEDYPFYPYGYLGLPVTTQDKHNTYQIYESDKVEITEELHVNPSYVNPWSPAQVNDYEKKIVKLSESFMNMLAEDVSQALGVE